MKGSKRYFVILGVFMVLAFVFQYYSPKPFRWTPTFYHNDRQPFGCYVFDRWSGRLSLRMKSKTGRFTKSIWQVSIRSGCGKNRAIS